MDKRPRRTLPRCLVYFERSHNLRVPHAVAACAGRCMQFFSDQHRQHICGAYRFCGKLFFLLFSFVIFSLYTSCLSGVSHNRSTISIHATESLTANKLFNPRITGLVTKQTCDSSEAYTEQRWTAHRTAVSSAK